MSDDDRRRHLLRRRAGQGPGLHRQRLGRSRRSSARPSAAVFSEYLSWRWIFFVNIPLCLLAAGMLVRNFQEQVERSAAAHRLPGRRPAHRRAAPAHPGLLEGGRPGPGARAPSDRVLVGRRRAARRLRAGRAPRGGAGAAAVGVPPPAAGRQQPHRAGVGAVLLGPHLVRADVRAGGARHGPLVAGFALATLTIGWPIAASQAGRVYLRIGFRDDRADRHRDHVAGTVLLLAARRAHQRLAGRRAPASWSAPAWA